MQRIKMCETSVLHGEEAVKWLYTYVQELETDNSTRLTERHKAALTKIAEALISTLETEAREDKRNKEPRLQIPLEKIKKAILKQFQNSKHEKTITVNAYHYSKPLIKQQIR